MQKPALLSLLVALGVLLGACRKEVEGFGLPESDAKLVVHCFISPQDDYLTASVTRSIPVLGTGNPADTLVKDAPTGIGHSPAQWEAEETISDQGQDGLRLVSPRAHWRGSGFQSLLRTSLNASLLHTDPHYYHYHRAVRRAGQSQANPFAEPALVYSNVTGGLGVFGAFTRTTTAVRIK